MINLISKIREAKFKKSSAGFTLIELLIYMAIFSILIVALFQLLTSILDLQLESESAGSVSQDGRFIVSRLSYDITRASSVTTPTLGNSGSTLVITDGTNTYSYSTSSGNLVLSVSPVNTTDQLNSADTTVSNLSFTHLADTSSKNDTVTVSFKLTSKVQRRGGPNSLNYKTTIGIRSP